MEGLTYPIPFSQPEAITRIAQAAEKLGYDSAPRPRLLKRPSPSARRGVTDLLGLYFAANSVVEVIDQMQMFAEQVAPKIR